MLYLHANKVQKYDWLYKKQKSSSAYIIVTIGTLSLNILPKNKLNKLRQRKKDKWRKSFKLNKDNKIYLVSLSTYCSWYKLAQHT